MASAGRGYCGGDVNMACGSMMGGGAVHVPVVNSVLCHKVLVENTYRFADVGRALKMGNSEKY